MPSAVFLSPHLDDAVFSAGGTIASLIDTGWHCVVATIFTASVPSPSGFALRCQTDKGLAPDDDYMAIRRAEDRRALAILGVRLDAILHLPLREAPHRGYEDAPSLFTGIRPHDETATVDVMAQIRPLVEHADRVYLPFGFGRHVDHLHVIRAADRLGVAAHRWADAPYVFREPASVVDGWDTLDLGPVFDRKAAACEAYETQLGFQFGGVAGVRPALRRHAEAVAAGRRLGLAEPMLRP